MENLFKFLHILAVIVWVGGVLTVNVLQVLTGKGHDRAAQVSLLRLSDLYGRTVIAPAAALTLGTGLVRVEPDRRRLRHLLGRLGHRRDHPVPGARSHPDPCDQR